MIPKQPPPPEPEDRPDSPEAVLEALKRLLALEGSVQLRLRLAHQVLALYFSGSPLDLHMDDVPPQRPH